MSDGSGLKKSRSSGIYNVVKTKITGLSASARHINITGKQPEMPPDYEDTVRDVVRNVKQLSDSDRTVQGKVARKKPGSSRKLSRDEQFYEQDTGLYDSIENEDIPAAVTIIDAMGYTMNAGAADVLAILLEYPDEDVRVHSAIALGKLGQRAAVEPLIKALDDKSAQVRENAAIALGAIGDNRAEIPLQKVPVDNPTVKRAAVNALARIENKRL